MKRSDSRPFWIMTAVMTFIVGLSGYQIIDGLIRGVIVAYSRGAFYHLHACGTAKAVLGDPYLAGNC